MGVLLDNGRYQVLECLHEEAGYSAFVCMDVELKNDFKPLIINVYSELRYINKFLPLFFELSPDKCEGFKRVVTGKSCIMAVFEYSKGTTFLEHLASLSIEDYSSRASALSSFFDAALSLEILPSDFAKVALIPANCIFTGTEKTIKFNYILKPSVESGQVLENNHGKDTIHSDFTRYIEAALIKNRYLPQTASEFLCKVKAGELMGFVEICSAWRHINEVAMCEHKEYKNETYFGYLKRRLKRKRKAKSVS